MLVYGDHANEGDPHEQASDVNRLLERAESLPPSLGRHAMLVDAFIKAGQLLQGVADALFDKTKRDSRSSATEDLTTFLLELSRVMARSWDSGFEEVGSVPRLVPAADWPERIELKVPEGFAFYALYPEAYLEASRRLELTGAPRIIGIRSIGTSLAAVAAVALGAPPPVTLRPFGDPFAREVAPDQSIESDLIEPETHYVIVDEGPGHSGSSFGAVRDWLHERGVADTRIALLPSHGGEPGPAASEERRCWYCRLQREVGDFGEDWPNLIGKWCTAVIGRLDAPVRDLSGGAWRELLYADDAKWPAAILPLERRKFLVRAGGAPFLVKFAGLGGIGEEKLAIARALHRQGLVPEPQHLVHGFLVESWCEGAAPLSHGEKPVAEIGRYLAARAQLLAGERRSGASIDELLAMVRRNISVEFGDAPGFPLERWARDAAQLERSIVRIRTDNKLDVHEWLRAPSGALVKTDALDHHQAHDLIGCQDIAWDVVGAAIEFDLDQSQQDELVRMIEERLGRVMHSALLRFYRIAYCAFRLGQARLGQAMVSDERERRRITSRGDRYAADLRHLLECSCGATRPESLVG